MKWFTGSNETELDIATDASRLVAAAPDYYTPRFDAIQELRKQDDGSLHRGQAFRRVASLVNVPMLTVMNFMDPEWMKNKRRFYAWLAKHPEYKTYETRGGSRLSETYSDGKPV